MKALVLFSLVTVTAVVAALREARPTAPVLIAQASVEAAVEAASVVEPTARRATFGGVPAVAAASVSEPLAKEDRDSDGCIPDEDRSLPQLSGLRQ